MLRLWIEVGAPYPGTYAALGLRLDRRLPAEPAGQHRLRLADHPGRRRGDRAALRRAATRASNVLPKSLSRRTGHLVLAVRHRRPAAEAQPAHRVQPDAGPRNRCCCWPRWPKQAGGLGLCRDERGQAGRRLRRHRATPTTRRCWPWSPPARRTSTQIKRFDMPGFRPRPDYLREMRRYGVLPADHPDDRRSTPTPWTASTGSRSGIGPGMRPHRNSSTSVPRHDNMPCSGRACPPFARPPLA